VPPAIGILLRATSRPQAGSAPGMGSEAADSPCEGRVESAALILQSPPATAASKKSGPGRASVGALVGGTTGSAGRWISAGW
jgi:hypothetical protein